MKKILSILLMLIYTTASSGTVLSLHYCMGDLAGISVGEKVSSQCGKCGMQDKDCCHDQPVIIKIENADAQQTAVVSCNFTAPDLPVVHHIKPLDTRSPKTLFSNNLSYIDGRPPAYVLHCVYRI